MSRSSLEPTRLLEIALTSQQDVVLCRQRAREIARMLGVETTAQVRLATAVSEIARNAVEYAGGGSAEFHIWAERCTLTITINDKGPGIARLNEIMEGCYQSPTGLGRGILGAHRLVDAVSIETAPGRTCIRLEKTLPTRARSVVEGEEMRKLQAALSSQPAANSLEEIAQQNRELSDAFAQLQAKHEEAEIRNQELREIAEELRETNRGVMALYDELDSLHRLSSVISAQLDVDTLVEAILQAATELCGGELGVFFYELLDSGSFRTRVLYGPLADVCNRYDQVYPEDLFGASAETAEVLRIGDLRESSFSSRRGDGCGLRSFLAVPVRSGGNHLLGAFLFGHREPLAFTERTERILSAAANQAAVGLENARLYTSVRHASAAKDRFLATLSHELRTPLNPIFILLAAMQRRSGVDPEMRENLRMMERNLRLEARLIDDLLDMTRISQGKMFCESRPIDVHEVITAAFETCVGVTPAKTHDCGLALRAERSMINGDAVRLQQLVGNLLNNAVKFTPGGGRISIETSNPLGTDSLRIDVADSGRGMDPGHFERIFRAFDQGSASGQPEFGGLGLGLAIAKSIAEAHGGRISANSPGVNQGSTFTVEFPVPRERLQIRAREDESIASSTGDGSGLRILIVEDHPDTRLVLTSVLTDCGHLVFAAADATAALAIAARAKLDLVVSDIGLPGRSGLELMRELQQRYQLPGIALSGYGTPADVQASLNAGFSQHLTKPIDLAVLEALLVDAAARQRDEQPLR